MAGSEVQNILSARLSGSPKPFEHVHTGAIRVFAVVPGDKDEPSCMVFARRQIDALRELGIVSHTFFLSSRTSPRILFQELVRFRRELKIFNPHIVHAHFGTVTALFCALASARPLVISFRGSDLNPSHNVSSLRSLCGRLFSQIAALRAQHLICVSEKLKKRIALPLSPASVIFDGVDLATFQPMDRDESRKILGWNIERKLVFFNLGGRPVGKRLDLAQAAVDFARKSIPEIELLPVTKVDPAKIPLMMSACDCLLLTSEWEGSPTVVKEAICCNLPVISVDVGDVTDLLQGVNPSRIVPCAPEAIGQALIDILRLNTRSNGSAHAHRLSADHTTRRVAEIYEGLVSRIS